ncbi:MAG: NAD(P)/FAD-dependent oxidoreductase, partial [bacterium]
MKETTRIVILGGGYGGVETARLLHKRYKRRKEVEITLIDKNPYHTLMTELHEVAASRVEPESVQISFRRIFSGKRVNVVVDTIDDIDFQNRKLISETAEYEYDYLVLGVGAEPEFYGIPGIQDHAYTLWSLEDALVLREHIEEQFRKAARERDPEKRRKMLTFAVAGAGFTGIEMAGELMEHRSRLCIQYGFEEEEVRIIVIEMMSDILPILPDKLKRKADKYLKKHGVEILLESPITEGASDYVEIRNEVKIPTETLIWTAGVMGCEFAGNLPLTKGRCSNKKCPHATKFGTCGEPVCEFAKDHRYVDGKRGRLLANTYMQSVDYENVYIVGDVTWIIENRSVVPQIVETALQTAETAARNIAADIDNGEKEEFESSYHGFMVSLGGRYGVAHVMGMKLTGFFAMAMKHLVNLHYLWGLGGVNAVWGYIKHEFLDVKDRRSFIGGHLSAKIRAYWAFPLRIFLGAKWFLEGFNKVRDGWLNPENIYLAPQAADNGTTATPGAEEWNNGGNGGNGGEAEAGAGASPAWEGEAEGAGEAANQAAEGAADAGSAATAAAEGAGEAANQAAEGAAEAGSAATAAAEGAGEAANQAAEGAAEAGSAATAAAEGAAEAAEGAVDAVAAATPAAEGEAWAGVEPLISEPLQIYQWFEETFIAQAPFFFQSVVVIAELGIGLALIGGLFTFLSAGASILLGLMFIVSAMTGPEILWYIFAAIVLLGGAGRGLGLDHWVIPWIKNWWNGRRIAKKT